VIGAAVDVGSNSVHLLIAELLGDGLRHIRDESVLLGLGDSVAQHGEIPPADTAQLIGALRAYRDLARSLGAATITFVGTQPLREARNAGDVAEQVEAATGIWVDVLSETAEARLTYLGATGGRAPAAPLLVVDIGGGSTEVIVGQPGRAIGLASLRTGSARLGDGIVEHDPPTANELDRLRMGARSLVGELTPADVSDAIFVGGTATNLVRLVPLTLDGLEQAHSLLTSLSAAELVERYGVNSRRARQLPAGLAIVEGLFAHYRLAEADVSQASLRDGAIIAAGDKLNPRRR
jgi:exopolyphosphatase/pppGpp-phosphohydrolase